MALVCDVREATVIIIGTWLYFLAAHYTKTLHSQGHLRKIDYILDVQRAEETYYACIMLLLGVHVCKLVSFLKSFYSKA